MIIQPPNQPTDAWYTQIKAQWLAALVLRARSLTRSLAAKTTHPLNTQSAHTLPFNTPLSVNSHFGTVNTPSTSMYHHSLEAFPLTDAPDRLAQSNGRPAQSNGSNQPQSNSWMAQLISASNHQPQSNGKLPDLTALATALSATTRPSPPTVPATTTTASTTSTAATRGSSHTPLIRSTHPLQ